MDKRFLLVLLMVFIGSCKVKPPEPLGPFFDELENKLNTREVQSFKNADASLVVNLNIFSTEIEELYYDSAYYSNLVCFFDNLGLSEIRYFEPVAFLRHAFYDKLNNKRFDLERMKNDIIRWDEEERIKEETYPMTDAQLFFQEPFWGKLSHIKKGDTVMFILPFWSDSIYYLPIKNSFPPPTDTFRIKGMIVDKVDNSSTKYLLNLVFSVKLIELDRDYLIDNRKYNVGDTLFIPFELEYQGDTQKHKK